MELLDEEDEAPPSPPLSPLPLEDEFRQLAIRSEPFSIARPMMHKAWSYLRTHDALFKATETVNDKAQVWQVSRLVLDYLNRHVRTLLKEQEQDIRKQMADPRPSASITSASEISLSGFSSPVIPDTPPTEVSQQEEEPCWIPALRAATTRELEARRAARAASPTTTTTSSTEVSDVFNDEDRLLSTPRLPKDTPFWQSITNDARTSCRHPGQGWEYNDPTSSTYVTFPIIHPTGKVLDATYVKYDLTPAFPQLLGTHSKGQPIHSQLLHPKRSPRQIDPYSARQKRLFDPKEPCLDWVEEALDRIPDNTLTAGVHHYMYLKKLVDATSTQIQNLLTELRTHTLQADEAMRDLENADAFHRVTTEITWLDKPDWDSYMSQAGKAYTDIVDPENPAHPSYICRYSAHENGNDNPTRRCFRCRLFGHLVKDCPNTCKPRVHAHPYAHPVRKSKVAPRK